MMPLQRACVGESQVRNTWSNGPLRAQSKVQKSGCSSVYVLSILRRCRQTSFAGGMIVSC